MVSSRFFTKLFKRDKKQQTIYHPFFEGYNQARSADKIQSACHAPFKSIYFGHYGKAVVCCYNRDHILGIYPQQSIKQIWFGEKAGELRTALTNYDFSHGCLSCLTQIKAGNYDATKAKQYDDHKQNSNKYPSVIEFELDNNCNLECVMCSGDFSSLIRKNREHKPPLQSLYDDAFVEQLREFIPYLEEVKFYGGEPFMIPIYYKIWDLTVSINPATRISIQTNATMLNSRIKDLLEQGNFHISISLDSIDKEIYESIRINAKYDLVMANVKWLIDYCKRKKTFIGISSCAMQQNWRDIPNILSFCNQHQVQLYLHTVFFPETSAIRSLNTDELNSIVHYVKPYLDGMPASTTIEKKNRTHYGDFVKQVEEWRNEASSNANFKEVNTPAELSLYISFQLNLPEHHNMFNEARRGSVIQKLKEFESIFSDGNPTITGLFDHLGLSYNHPMPNEARTVKYDDEFNFIKIFNYIEIISLDELQKSICIRVDSVYQLFDLTLRWLVGTAENEIINPERKEALHQKIYALRKLMPKDIQIGHLMRGVSFEIILYSLENLSSADLLKSISTEQIK